jgi:hypothetical protein
MGPFLHDEAVIYCHYRASRRRGSGLAAIENENNLSRVMGARIRGEMETILNWTNRLPLSGSTCRMRKTAQVDDHGDGDENDNEDSE